MLHILDSALWREMVSANQSFERKGLKMNIEFESEMGTHCLKISKNNFPVPVLTDETLTGTRLGKRTNKKFNFNNRKAVKFNLILVLVKMKVTMNSDEIQFNTA